MRRETQRCSLFEEDAMCSVKFLDADVTRPLASVSAFVDEGNRVAFGSMQSYIEHVLTGQTIPMCRKNACLSYNGMRNRARSRRSP